MPRYRYAGPGPHFTDNGKTGAEYQATCIRPGDVLEFDEEPPFSPFELLPDDEEPAAAWHTEPSPAGIAAATARAASAAPADAQGE